jgi:hypothetical protein
MRLNRLLTLFLVLCVQALVTAQVWYPEGVYMQKSPAIIAVDNQLMSISKEREDGPYSYWLVSINDGKAWTKLPLVKLDAAAVVTGICKYQGMVYVSGRFAFDNGAYNALVRYNTLTAKWQGIGKFLSGNVPAAVHAMEVHGTQLLLGGDFFYIENGAKKDTCSYLARFNGVKFNYFFDGGKSCNPDSTVTDIAANDSIVAVSGHFEKINKHRSKYLLRIYPGTESDTFINSPEPLERLALNGRTIYASGQHHLFRISRVFVPLVYNLDTAFQVNRMVWFDNSLVVNGKIKLSGQALPASVIRLENSSWTDISNNFRDAHDIAAGRSMLFAAGRSTQPVSIWNPNNSIMRFFPALSLVRARVFLDSNNNCLMEPGERPVARQFIRLPFLNRGVITNEQGMAEFLVPNITQNTLKFIIRPLRNYMRSNCADTTVTRTFVPGIYLDSIQFPLVRVPDVNDIRIVISSPKGLQVLKNKRVLYRIVYENVGSNILSGKVRLKKHPLLSNEKTEPAASAINSSVYEWSYANLRPGEKKILIYTGVAEDTIFSDDFTFNALAASEVTSGTARNTDDDFDSIPQQMSSHINAFRKDVYPAPQSGDSITYLERDSRDLRYQISFNNFGTDTVFYAVIIDTLDLNLDMSYIQETGSNKHYYTEVQTDPDNQYKGILIWHFPDIRLAPNPGMDYESLSSGSYIGFKVITKPMSNGYVLKNIASVFYDNVYAGSTNPVYCTMQLTGIDELNTPGGLLAFYPNPFQEQVNLVHPFRKDDLVKVFNSNGQEVYRETLCTDQDRLSLELPHVSSGIYVIQVLSEGKVLQGKVLKQ